MATDVCAVQMTGRLTKDLSATALKSGDVIINFSIAVDESFKRKEDTDWTEKTSFYNGSFFTRNPDRYLKKMEKGDKVFISGGMTIEQWESKDGEKKQGLKLKPQFFTLIKKKRGANGQQQDNRKSSTAPDPFDGQETGDDVPF